MICSRNLVAFFKVCVPFSQLCCSNFELPQNGIQPIIKKHSRIEYRATNIQTPKLNEKFSDFTRTQVLNTREKIKKKKLTFFFFFQSVFLSFVGIVNLKCRVKFQYLTSRSQINSTFKHNIYVSVWGCVWVCLCIWEKEEG